MSIKGTALLITCFNGKPCYSKDQLISKCLFWYLQFSQKLNENNSAWGTMVVKSNSFVRFLGEFKIPNRHFENNGPLDQAVWDQCFNGSCLDLWTWVMLRIISPKNKTNNELNKVDVLQFQKYTFFIQARGLKILYHSFFLKGQLISEGLFDAIVATKNTMIFFLEFLP